MLKGVRGSEPVNREALAKLIVDVSELVTDFPEISEMDLNPVFASKNGAIAADVRIVVDFAAKKPRYRPAEDDVLSAMNRIMQPKAVAVIGASSRRRQDRQLGDEEPDQRRLQGPDLPDPPEGRRDHGLQGLQERQGRARRDRHGRVRDSRQVRRRRADRMRREEDRRRSAHSLGLRRDRPARDAGRARRDRPQVQHPPDGAEHLRLLLHAGQPVRDLLHRLRREGQRRAVVAIGRHRHGDHRLQPLGQDGRVGDRRPGQQVGHRRGRSADLLRAGPEHQSHRAALRGPERRPRVRRSRQARLEEEAGDRAEGRPHLGRRQGRELAHRRAGRQRQDLRRRAEAGRRDPRAQPARPARLRARRADAADAERRERRHHHRRRRLRRAARPTPASTTG